MERNYVEIPIIPDSPKVVPNEVVHVYLPMATSDIPGIAKYSSEYFSIIDGVVVLNEKYLNENSQVGVVLKDYVDNELKFKLDKVEGVASNVYAVDKDGKQVMIPYSSSKDAASHIVIRDAAGRLFSLIPTTDDEVANKKYVDDETSKKLDKRLSEEPYTVVVYAADTVEQFSIKVNQGSVVGTIPIRNLDGTFDVDSPIADLHVANKMYVDDEIDNAVADKLVIIPVDYGVKFLYAGDSSGQLRIDVEEKSTENTVPIRNSNGTFSVSEPTSSSNPATKNYVDTQLANFDFIKVVDTLPSEGLPNKIYFVPKGDIQNSDLFDEYVWINDHWEWITTKQLEIDLTPYAKKEWAQAALDSKLAEKSYLGRKSQAYVVNADGVNDVLPYSSDLLKNGLIQRDKDGRAKIENPQSSSDIANKEYVDSTNNIFIRYSANADGTDFTETRSEGQNYVGFAAGQIAPTDKSGYSWCRIADTVNVVQTTGNSETDAMSQKAVTDEFGKRFTRAIICPPDTGIVSFDTTTKQLYIPDILYIVNGIYKTFGKASTVDLSVFTTSDVHVFIDVKNNKFHAVGYGEVKNLSSNDYAYFCSVRVRQTAERIHINLPFPYLIDGKLFGEVPERALSENDMSVGDSEINIAEYGLRNYTLENGKAIYYDKRCSTKKFIFIGNASKFTAIPDTYYKFGISFYREADENTYICDLGGWINTAKEVNVPKGANFLRVVFAHQEDSVITTETSRVKLIRHGIDYRQSFASIGEHSYIGEKIPSKVNHFDSELALTMNYDGSTDTSQDIEIFGDYMFVAFSGNERIEVYSLTSKTLLAQIPLDTHHGTGMQFSGEYYNEGDTFPLLYIGGWTDQIVVALRIIETNGSWTATVIREIKIPENCGYFPAPSIDARHNVLYCYGYKEARSGGDNAMVLSKFDLKVLTDNGDGTYSAKLLSMTESAYLGVIQGRKYYQGRLYVGFTDTGSPRNSRLVVVDAATGDVKTFIDMTPVTASENEGICYQIDGDNIYWYYSDYYNVFKLTF